MFRVVSALSCSTLPSGVIDWSLLQSPSQCQSLFWKHSDKLYMRRVDIGTASRYSYWLGLPCRRVNRYVPRGVQLSQASSVYDYRLSREEPLEFAGVRLLTGLMDAVVVTQLTV